MEKRHWNSEVAQRNRALRVELEVLKIRLELQEEANDALLEKVADMADELETARNCLYSYFSVGNSA
jgi:hypothetical protein